MATETDNAGRVCQSHVEELERFDEWVSDFGCAYRDDVERWADADEDEADDDKRAMAREVLAWLDDNGADRLDWSAFVNGALDIEVTGRLDSTGWEWTDVALLVSYGGPTVRLVAVDQDTIRVDVSWWGDQASTVLRCGLAGELCEIADERASVVAR